MKNRTRPAFFFILAILCLPATSNAQNKEPWIDKSFENWPQIALVNDVMYKNGDRYEDPTITYAASAFLLDTGKDTLAVTAKHILWVARNKQSDKVVINDALQYWKMYPRHNPGDSVVIDKLINEDPGERLFDGPEKGVLKRDWIVFTTKYISPGIKPLKLRKAPLHKGDPIYLTGNPYRFDQTLTAKGHVAFIEGAQIIVEFDGPGMDSVFLGGASGSPIIDSNGHLAGIFSNSILDEKTGKRVTYVNSTAYLRRILSGATPLNAQR